MAVVIPLFGILHYWLDKFKDFDKEETKQLVESIGELDIDESIKTRVEKYIMDAKTSEKEMQWLKDSQIRCIQNLT